MRFYHLGIFLLALSLGLLAAWYRFGDSAHAMGLISNRGGSCRHAVILEPHLNRYAVIVTAAVLPPWQGDARVSLVGEDPPQWELHPAGPIIDLGVHRQPKWRDGVFYDLQPRDRLAVWVQLQNSAESDPRRVLKPLSLQFHEVGSEKLLLEVPIRFAAREDSYESR